jgi:hypothetical protein
MPEGAMMADENDVPLNADAPDGATGGDGGTEVIENSADTHVADANEADDEPVTPESLASELGWAPKEDWRGDPADWKDAKTFLKSTVDINKTLRKDLKATRDASERAARAAAAITEQALERQRQELFQARQQAFDAGDGQAFNAADQQLRSLPPPQAPAQSDESQSFFERNASWYGKNKEASDLAYAKCEELARLGVAPAQQLVLAEQAVRQAFPELFQTQQQTKGPAQVATPGTRASAQPRKGPKGFNDLPPDAKRAALDFEKRGRASRDEYAKLYFEENA